jgi:hypothetical protein
MNLGLKLEMVRDEVLNVLSHGVEGGERGGGFDVRPPRTGGFLRRWFGF